MPAPASRRPAPVIPIRPLSAPATAASPADSDEDPPTMLTAESVGLFPGATRGRGAVSSPIGRFERTRRALPSASVADRVGFDALGAMEAAGGREDPDPEGPPRTATEVRLEHARTIISRINSPDIRFDRSINPYRGCEHGCVYCYARPNHAYVGLSPGLDFETRLIAKVNAGERLIEALSAPGYQCAEVAIGAATDAYQPIEREYRLTRRVLEVLAEHRHPASVITKSALVERDIDLLGPMASRGLAYVGITVTTLDEGLARVWEPRAAAPWRRLKTIKRLSDAGIPVVLMVAPIVPFINDRDIERIIEQGARAGARAVRFTVLRLPDELREVFGDWLAHHFPDRQKRVWARIEELRGGGGRRNDARFHSRMTGQGHWADLIRLRIALAARKSGIQLSLPALRTDLFRPPSRDGQLGLF